MTAPTNMEDLTARFMENTKVEGFGLETTQILACPFCGAPGMMKMRVIDPPKTQEAVCEECGRGMKNIVRDSGDGQIRFHIVQTVGPDAPAWLEPMIQREVQANPPAGAV